MEENVSQAVCLLVGMIADSSRQEEASRDDAEVDTDYLETNFAFSQNAVWLPDQFWPPSLWLLRHS